jgi:hypothetical protein
MPLRISRRTQLKFAEFATGHSTVGRIYNAFEAEGFAANPDQEDVGGQRRTASEAFHSRIDLHSDRQNRKLLDVYLEALTSWLEPGAEMPKTARELIRSLQRDGAPLDDTGRLAGPLPADGAIELGDFHLLRDPGVLEEHLDRMLANVERDTPAVIGAAKELVESVCKLVLDDYGVAYGSSATLPELYKAVSWELGLSRQAVPTSAKGSEAAQRVLQSMVTAVQNLAELRNALGVGHGRAQRVPALERHARLAMNASRTIAEFLLATWHERKGAPTSDSTSTSS